MLNSNFVVTNGDIYNPVESIIVQSEAIIGRFLAISISEGLPIGVRLSDDLLI